MASPILIPALDYTISCILDDYLYNIILCNLNMNL